jgi:hypothetical protein
MQLGVVQTRVAESAVRAIPGADGARLTLLEDRHNTIVASAPFVAQVDAIQYRVEEGAAAEVVISSVGKEPTDTA